MTDHAKSTIRSANSHPSKTQPGRRGRDKTKKEKAEKAEKAEKKTHRGAMNAQHSIPLSPATKPQANPHGRSPDMPKSQALFFPLVHDRSASFRDHFPDSGASTMNTNRPSAATTGRNRRRRRSHGSSPRQGWWIHSRCHISNGSRLA